MGQKKYELISETKYFLGKTLYRIKALISFGDVKIGDIGGFVESDKNLSHDGNAWVYDDARVWGNARVYGNAQVYGNARVYDDAWVWGDARVCGDAQVYGNAQVWGDAWVATKSSVFWISCIGSRNGTTTFFKSKNKEIKVVCGCFYGTLDEFSQKVNQTHGDSFYGKCYQATIELAKIRLGESDDAK